MAQKKIILFLLLFPSFLLSAEENEKPEAVADTTNTAVFTISSDDPIIATLDLLVLTPYFDKNHFVYDTLALNKYHFPKDSIPNYPDSVYVSRIATLNAKTPFNLTYNQRVKAFLNLYAVDKKEVTSKVLGLANMYFPLFEEMLDKYDLPLEFKYLAVVESALNAKAKSRSGAMGLWQFMYRTGRIYDLHVTSYIDDRKDPYKSTEAACKYLKFLYKIYGNWEMVMAAYNCGPGNVNRAIRRSGYKHDYWEIYRYLPRETRGYIPAFIAVNYIMNYATEHNIYPVKPRTTFFEYDTVMVKEEVTFEQISQALSIPMETVEYLNPMYKRKVIPFLGKPKTLCLPHDKVGLFIRNEELVYKFNEPEEIEKEEEIKFTIKQQRKTHVVRRGEYLGLIAIKYGCSVRDIKDWNGLRSTTILQGQRLLVYVSEKVPVLKENTKSQLKEQSENFKYYTVQQGDTLWDIANTQGVSVQKLIQMNRSIDAKNLKPGAKIVVGTGG